MRLRCLSLSGIRKAFATYRSHQAFAKRIRLRGLRRRAQDFHSESFPHVDPRRPECFDTCWNSRIEQHAPSVPYVATAEQAAEYLIAGPKAISVSALDIVCAFLVEPHSTLQQRKSIEIRERIEACRERRLLLPEQLRNADTQRKDCEGTDRSQYQG